MSRVYFHIDMNAFFVSAEKLLDPSLEGKPVAVGGNTRRSVVSTASYEARKLGIHSAMPMTQALELCPELIVIPPHFSYYRELSDKFIALIRSYTDLIEQASIDECYADMTEPISHYDPPLMLAHEIQNRIRSELGLPCSIGIGPNMFLAKMASDMKKPMGITVLRIRDVPTKMWPLPIGDMRGVGKKTEPILLAMNIRTIGDLANYRDIEKLRPVFGKRTEEILERTRGIDHRTLVTDWNPKSMGISETLTEDVDDYDELRGILRSLSRRLAQRMKKDQKLGTGITVRIRRRDFHNADRSAKCAQPIWKSEDIFRYAAELFDANWDHEPVRLLGISMNGLKDPGDTYRQMDLFNMKEAEKEETAYVIKDLNRMLDGSVFKRASDLVKNNDTGNTGNL